MTKDNMSEIQIRKVRTIDLDATEVEPRYFFKVFLYHDIK